MVLGDGGLIKRRIIPAGPAQITQSVMQGILVTIELALDFAFVQRVPTGYNDSSPGRLLQTNERCSV